MALTFTFQDVDALLVGRVRVGVVGRRERAAVDVAHPGAAVVLVGTLGAMIAGGIWRQRVERERENRRRTDGLSSRGGINERMIGSQGEW